VPLASVNDFFKKIILVKDVVNVTRDEVGITTMSIYDFLLKKDFYTAKVPKNAVKWEFFGSVWCLGGV
jgi:hypothetical protein